VLSGNCAEPTWRADLTTVAPAVCRAAKPPVGVTQRTRRLASGQAAERQSGVTAKGASDVTAGGAKQ
jgi:hypothetical protein